MTTNSTDATAPIEAEKKEKNIKRFWVVGMVIIVVIIISAAVWFNHNKATTAIATAATTTATTSSATTSTPSAAVMAKTITLLTNAGWSSSQYTFNIVESNDPTTGGQDGDFSSSPIRSASEMVAFLKTSSSGASGIKSSVESSTGATEAELEDPNNWVAVQSLVPFSYPGNTGLKNGAIFGAGTLSGYTGEIFLVFVAPETVADASSTSGTITVRTACANPQTVCPTPVSSSTSTSTSSTTTSGSSSTSSLAPKSSNIEDYQRPGTDDTTDSGTGDKPQVTEDEPAESSPLSNNGSDSVTDTPGSETHTTAPGASSSSSSSTPSTETGANPSSGSNSGDPGLPNGF